MKILVPLSLFALAACAAPAREDTSSQGDAVVDPIKQCDIASARYAVGKPFTDALAAELKKKVGANTIRVIPPGMMVTMDYRGDRLNISHDERNIITEITCG